MSTSFADLGVPADLGRLLAGRGIDAPFPIQAATLPDALAGRDICGRAPTGSGKTLAFGLTIAARAKAGAPGLPSTLVLVPTRELAAQVAKELDALRPFHGHRSVTVYGGTGYGGQRSALRKGAGIVVACPGRLEDLVAQGDLSLAAVDLVVLDEADRMADMGFLPAVKRLLDQTSNDRQTLLFSATLDHDIDVLIKRYQNNPAHHEVVLDDDETGDVTHAFWKVERDQRIPLTAGLVRQHGKVVVFCRTRHGADRLTKQLARVGVDARAVHGSRSQIQREKALAAFTGGQADALVATDVAARGIHIDAVTCVVHFDLPPDPKDYVHRSGRTGRAGADGAVVAMVLKEQNKLARTLQRHLGLDQRFTDPDLPEEMLEPGEPVKPQPEPQPRPRGKGQGPRHANSNGHRRRKSRPNGQGARSGQSNGNGSGGNRPKGQGSRNGNGSSAGRPSGNGRPGGRPGGRNGGRQNRSQRPASSARA
jgi:superfamily II DNA/RNA helicase